MLGRRRNPHLRRKLDRLELGDTTRGPSEKPSFIPYDVAPRLKNPVEIQRLLQRTYPPQLREAKVEGKVVLWIYIDDRGNVLKSHVQRSSGYIAMDRVAQECADEMEFTPAKNRDKRAAGWVSQAISFGVHGAEPATASRRAALRRGSRGAARWPPLLLSSLVAGSAARTAFPASVPSI